MIFGTKCHLGDLKATTAVINGSTETPHGTPWATDSDFLKLWRQFGGIFLILGVAIGVEMRSLPPKRLSKEM